MKKTPKQLAQGIKNILDSSVTEKLSAEERDILTQSVYILSGEKSKKVAAAKVDEKPKNVLSLKWGTLKSWHFEKAEALKLLKEYEKIGASFSAAMQYDTPRQKEIVCALIDLCDTKTIYLHWDGKYVSKKKAKEYVMDYVNQ